MNVAKWLLVTILMWPVLELAAFIFVAALIGFAWALGLLFATSFLGLLLLKFAGGAHVERMRVALGASSFSALRADAQGSLVLFAAILLLIPGFITDFIGLLLLFHALLRALRGRRSPAPRADGVVDLEAEEWHRVPDRQIPEQRDSPR